MQKCCTVRLHGQDLRDGCRCFFICAENNLARGRSLYTPHSSVCASDFDKRFHTSKGFSPDVNFELTQVAVKLIKPHQSHHNSAVFPPDTRSKQQEREIIRNWKCALTTSQVLNEIKWDNWRFVEQLKVSVEINHNFPRPDSAVTVQGQNQNRSDPRVSPHLSYAFTKRGVVTPWLADKLLPLINQ